MTKLTFWKELYTLYHMSNSHINAYTNYKGYKVDLLRYWYKSLGLAERSTYALIEFIVSLF